MNTLPAYPFLMTMMARFTRNIIWLNPSQMIDVKQQRLGVPQLSVVADADPPLATLAVKALTRNPQTKDCCITRANPAVTVMTAIAAVNFMIGKSRVRVSIIEC
jgi:hypothetical protein